MYVYTLKRAVYTSEHPHIHSLEHLQWWNACDVLSTVNSACFTSSYIGSVGGTGMSMATKSHCENFGLWLLGEVMNFSEIMHSVVVCIPLKCCKNRVITSLLAPW